MNIVLIIATIIIIALGVIHNPRTSKVLSEQTKQPEITKTPAPTASTTPTPSPISTLEPQSPTLSPQPTIYLESNDFLKSFIYPNGQINSQSQNSISQETDDQPGTVQKWYEDRVNGKGFSKVSWNIKNHNSDSDYTLECVQNGKSAHVNIKRSSSNSKTSISIGY
ncbi:hypothetical protein HYS03_01450 [Candidatus Woesebacteria bacterium]|nr:hypothetical protein [Candidatus Woesebacteria bacterium]QQG47932.1 MAG: hypothetical protein HY044_02495 [Candidatus Woesebacteria bacterium]